MNTRRNFLKQALATSTAIGFPTIIPSSVLGKDAPSNKITVGFIGTGSHGIHRNLNMYLRQPDARILAVCDVFKSRRKKAKGMVDNHNKNKDCTTHNDFREILARKDIDTVMISTPDHWHTLMSLMALRAGKDVQCEKPTLTIAEGRLLADTVKARKAVFQTSTEDRSMRVYHRLAELVRNGRIGRLKTIRVKLPAGNRWPTGKPVKVPDDLDYDLWLGPAPEAPYTQHRTEPMRWRQIWDYSGGLLTDWGAHQLDTAQWANDTENTGPISVEGKGTFNEGSMYNTAISYKLKYTYANGVELHVESGGTSLRFEGTDGWVGNSGWARPPQASSKEILESKIGPEETHLFTCREGEHRNFLDCVKSRKDPYLPAETGHRLASLMHMGNISMRLDRKLQWNPEKEVFAGDKEANAMLSKPMRKPWSLEA
ncbi:MAG: Gfo/Idh/MocA family oxidoreductase [Opitutae bacterium]|nr:Gfo/Idh/MocA family oxidoreductase [Opitutae bacterium]